MIPLEDPWEKINKKIGQEEIEEKGDQVTDEDEANKEFEELEQTIAKPVDANSEVVPNKNLTDEEIATLILEEEELLDAGDQGVLG